MVPPRTLQRWADVETEDDFVAYLGLLAADARDPGNGWSSRNLPEFLHGWARWIDDALAQGSHADLLERPSRRALAGQLFQARTARAARPDGAARIPDAERVVAAADLAGWLRHLLGERPHLDLVVAAVVRQGGPTGRTGRIFRGLARLPLRRPRRTGAVQGTHLGRGRAALEDGKFYE